MVGLRVAIQKKLGNFSLSVDFAVEASFVVLFGASGCGKSSTLAALAGLLQPEKGCIQLGSQLLFDGARKINLSPQQRRIGYVFQNYALFPHLRVRENICFGIDQLSKTAQQECLDRLISIFRLDRLTERYPGELSGGQQQRVALARALAPNPQLLLLDEPFSALDEELRDELRDELKDLHQRLNLPILMVTHSRAEALQLAETVILMKSGSVSAIGLPAEVLSTSRSMGQTPRFSW
ncbi:MAG: ATP-binding cassette domain-containing protein [Anaerolineae bacterium]|nr:ATP-binding cassette domain-containing protein [Gloeobacterales cyanobacterium ES-bin-313]